MGTALVVYLTAFAWQDNDPPGSGTVGSPVLHKTAAGQGTYSDPITVAVPGEQNAMSYPPGTRFYLPTIRRYVIVEDSGAPPGPAGTSTHLDVWIDGHDAPTVAAVEQCEDAITGTVKAYLNPPPDLDVIASPIYANGACRVPG
jgi:hypothetical protein